MGRRQCGARRGAVGHGHRDAGAGEGEGEGHSDQAAAQNHDFGVDGTGHGPTLPRAPVTVHADRLHFA